MEEKTIIGELDEAPFSSPEELQFLLERVRGSIEYELIFTIPVRTTIAVSSLNPNELKKTLSETEPFEIEVKDSSGSCSTLYDYIGDLIEGILTKGNFELVEVKKK